MLYISPIFKLERFKNVFGYADDVALLETLPSLEENAEKLAASINQTLTWGHSEGLIFDP